jgi:16S rRNA C1402 N4-methylase RsmH
MYREVLNLVSDFIDYRKTDDEGKIFQMADCTFGGGGHSLSLLN